MYEIVTEFPNDLFLADVTPCISLYQTTHRHGPDNQQDPIRFKNLTQEIEQSLSESYSKKEVQHLLKPFKALATDRLFWEHATDGMAIFATDGKCVIYRLQRTVQELAIVATSFHIKPLIRVFQSADRYHLLGLSKNEYTLFEGNRYDIAEVSLDDSLPRTMKEVLGDQFEKPYLTAGSYKGANNKSAMFHGHGSKKDVIDIDIERFFRFVDRTILENYSQPLKLPLYLVALDEHHTPFRALSRNPFLEKDGIRVAYDTFTLKELKERAWQMIEPKYLEKTQILVDDFERARAQEMGSDDIEEVAKAATQSRVRHLLIEADRIIPGHIDLTSGEILKGNLEHSEIDDLLDDLAEIVIMNQAEVVVVPAERMPSTTGVAAVYRY